MTTFRLSILTLTVHCSFALPASADRITFSDRTTFASAVGEHKLIDFETYPAGTISEGFLYLGDVAFESAFGLRIDAELGAPPSRQLANNAIPDEPDKFLMRFSGAILGFDVISAATSGAPYRVVLTETDGMRTAYDFRAGPFVPTFFGAWSPLGFTQASFHALREQGGLSNFGIDNVAVATLGPIPSPVPEPTVALVITALALAAIRMSFREGLRLGSFERTSQADALL